MNALSPWPRKVGVPPTLAAYSSFRRWRITVFKIVAFPTLAIFSFLYGAAFALFGPSLLIVIVTPIVVLSLLVIWALPDVRAPPLSLLVTLFYISVVADYAWPNYLAITFRGLPWITISRLIGYPLFLLSLTCLSVSSEFRNRIYDVIKASPWLSALVAAFLFIQIFSVTMSSDKAASVNKLVGVVVSSPRLLIALYLFSQKGKIKNFLVLLWGTAMFVGFLGLWQYKLHHVPWAGHTPAFLQVSDPVVLAALGGTSRAYTNEYRINSTFITSLGLSEFMALVYPFIVYILVNRGSFVLRVAAGLSLPVTFLVVLLTGSRLGVVGCLLSTCLYPAFVGLRGWRRDKGSLFAPAVSLAYPVLFAAAVGSTFFIGRLKAHVWGSGAQAGSTNSRLDQIRMGLPKIIHNPLGYGIGRGADTLGYQPYGFLTIDSYYLLIALEYGVVGFLLFYGAIVLGIVKAGRLAIEPEYFDLEQGLAIPICVALISFIIIKGVFAQPDNINLMYFMLTFLAALAYRRSLASVKELSGPELVERL